MLEKGLVRLCVAFAVAAVACAVSAHELQFVQVASTTNASVADFTKSLNAGIELAFDRLNRTGAVKAGKLRLTLVDDQFSSKKAVEIVNTITEDKEVLGLIGCVGTAALTELTKTHVLTNASLATIGPYTGMTELLKEPNVFPVRASYEAELERIFQQAASLNQKKAAVVWWQAGVGPSLSRSAPAIAKASGVTLTSNIGFEVNADKNKLAENIVKAVNASAAAKPDAVLLVSAGQSGYLSVKAVRAVFGGGMPVYSISALGWKDLIDNVGIGQARGVVISQAVPFPYSGVKTALVREYLEDMATAKREPDYASLEGYLAGRVLGMALAKVHKPVTRAAVLAALNGLGKVESGDFLIDYSPKSRTSMKSADITMISSSGRLVK